MGFPIPGPIGPMGTSGLALIAVINPTGTNTVTFSSIPGTYKHLRLVGMGRSSGAGTGNDFPLMTFNADGAAHYARQTVEFTGVAAPSSFQATADSGAFIAVFPTAGDIANYPGTFILDIINYANTTFAKNYQGQYMGVTSALLSSLFTNTFAGVWSGTAAITSITIAETSNYVTGTSFSLYGFG